MTKAEMAHDARRYMDESNAPRVEVLSADDDVRLTLQRLDALATVMDSAIRIPGTEVAMGLDALLGLIPVIGDAISGAIGAYLIWEAKRLGVSKLTLMRMATNTAVDSLLGSIPLAGDVFDIAFKSNKKNVALLKAHLARHGRKDSRTIEASYRVEG